MYFWKELSLNSGSKMSRWPRRQQRESQRRNKFRLESFRFQDENDYENDIWIKVFSQVICDVIAGAWGKKF